MDNNTKTKIVESYPNAAQGVAAILQASDLLIKAGLVLVGGFLLLAIWFNYKHLDVFVSQVLLWAGRVLIVVAVVLAYIAIRKILASYHAITMEHYERRNARTEIERKQHQTERARLQNEHLQSIINVTNNFPNYIAIAAANGMNIEFTPKGELRVISPFSNVHTLAGQEQQAMMTGPKMPIEVQKPTMDEIVSFVKRNSFELVLGRSLNTREFIVNELVDSHIKLIGGTRMGKSCEAGAIIKQVTETHDVDCLQIALLDLEYKTSRLFEYDEHVLILNVGQLGNRPLKIHAKDMKEVAQYMVYLHDEMLRRYLLPDAVVEALPRILIYLEEFLYWKKLLGQFVSDELKEQALASFTGIATRGLKVGMHLMACAQVSYADKGLQDAMAQFLAINLAFSVNPNAARAAGFVDSELLKTNFQARTPGQFVVESVGGSDIGVAPDFDVKARLAQLPSGPVVLASNTLPDAVITGNRPTGEQQQQELEEQDEQEFIDEPKVIPIRKVEPRKALFSDAVEVWNSCGGNIGRPRLREELQKRGLECSDDLAKTLLKNLKSRSEEG